MEEVGLELGRTGCQGRAGRWGQEHSKEEEWVGRRFRLGTDRGSTECGSRARIRIGKSRKGD